MAAILKALITVMNENRRHKVFTVIKQLTMQQYSKDKMVMETLKISELMKFSYIWIAGVKQNQLQSPTLLIKSVTEQISLSFNAVQS